VTGTSNGRGTEYDCATIAYDASTGAARWVSRYDGSGRNDGAGSIAVSPDGSEVFIAGYSINLNDDFQKAPEFLTVGYGASSGEQLWEVSLDSLFPDYDDAAFGVAVSLDSRTVYSTGSIELSSTARIFTTIAIQS
jgi:hypothetical protein